MPPSLLVAPCADRDVPQGLSMSATVRAGYKQTNVGIIPADWTAASIGEVVSFSGGTQPPRSTFRFAPAREYIRLVQIRDYKSDAFETYIPMSLARNRCNVDDVMIGRYGPPVFQILKGIEGAYNVALIKTHPSNRIERGYMYYVLKQDKLFRMIDAMSRRSSGQTGVEMPALKSYGLPLPTLPEQRAITAALSDVDALLSKLDAFIAKKRDLKQAAMQRLLSGQTRLPGFSGEWEVKLLGGVGRFLKGSGVRKDESLSGSLRCIRYGEIYTRHNDYIKTFYSWISERVSVTATRLKCGDLCFAGSGETKEDIGKCVAFIDASEAYAGGDIVILRPENANAVFLGYYLNTRPINSQKASRGQGDAVVHISATALSGIEITVPKLEEQTAIATVLSDMDAELTALEARRDKTRVLKQGMMQELLTGRIRLV